MVKHATESNGSSIKKNFGKVEYVKDKINSSSLKSDFIYDLDAIKLW